MKRIIASLVLVGLICMTALAGIASAQSGTEIIFDSTPQPLPLPPNIVSQAFQATSTDEFGDHIAFGNGLNRALSSVTVTMSAWGKQSEYPLMTDPAGWQHPITLNLYAVDHSSGNPAPGVLIATTTQTFLIPWRPAPDLTCAGGTAWRASDNQCYNGLAFNIVFNIANVDVPDELIYGIAYNTQTYGASPLGVTGPYNSLNVGLNTVAPSIGTDVNPDVVFWDTSHGPFYTDGGAGGTDTFRRDTAWTGYVPTVQFAVTYELPTTDEMLNDLQSDTSELVTHKKSQRTLLAALARAEKYMESRPQIAYIAIYQYIIQVQVFEWIGLITPDAADQLTAQAQELLASLN